MNPEIIINNKSYRKAEGLESLSMFKGQLYETIVTTQNGELVKNAAPIGVICKDSNHVVIHLDNCVHTHLNILENGELIVNITKDPLVFTISTLGELDDKYFDEFKGFPMIKHSIGFFKAHVVKTRDKKREKVYYSTLEEYQNEETEEMQDLLGEKDGSALDRKKAKYKTEFVTLDSYLQSHPVEKIKARIARFIRQILSIQTDYLIR